MYDKLLDLQQNPPQLLKDAVNPHFGNDYISLGAVLEAVVPELTSRGLVLTQAMTYLDSNGTIVPALQTRLTEAETDEFISNVTPLVLEKESPQAVGSAITYFRRYGILTLLGFNADADDDAEATKGTVSKSKSTSGQSGQKRGSKGW